MKKSGSCIFPVVHLFLELGVLALDSNSCIYIKSFIVNIQSQLASDTANVILNCNMNDDIIHAKVMSSNVDSEILGEDNLVVRD